MNLKTTAEERTLARIKSSPPDHELYFNMIYDIETLLKERQGLLDDINKAMERVKKLEEALKWYADRNNYYGAILKVTKVDTAKGEITIDGFQIGDRTDVGLPVNLDEGQRARQALGEG